MEDGLRQVGAFEAKNTLGNCSTWSTRLAPARPISNREQARAAIQRIRERAEQRKFGPFDWSEWKNQPGRWPRLSLVLDSSATLVWCTLPLATLDWRSRSRTAAGTFKIGITQSLYQALAR